MSLEGVENRFVRYKGMIIDPEKIENPRLRAVFRERVYDGEKFLFFGNHNDHTESPSPYSERKYSESGNHTDHSDKHTDHEVGILTKDYPDHKDKHTDEKGR